MNTTISKLASGLFIALTALAFFASDTKAWAACFDNHGQILSQGCWELGAAALYQQHCVQNFTFATDQASNIAAFKGRSYDVAPKFYWGFRLWASWHSCDGSEFATLAYKHLWSNKDARQIQADALIPNLTSLATNPRGRQRLQYDTVYLRLAPRLFCACNASFYAYGGLRYVGAEIRRQVKAQGATRGLKTMDRSFFQGGGVEAGVGGEYGLGCGFNIVGTLGAMALIGKRNQTSRIVANTNSLPSSQFFPDHNITKCVPGVDFRAAINYNYDFCTCGCSMRLVAELGWEMDYYWSILVLRDAVMLNAVSTTTFDHVSPVNFGTNGPYGSLTIRF